MPGFDGTGPRGMGPMTGGGRGFCSPRGLRASRRGGAYRGYPGIPYPPYYNPGMTAEQEVEFLRSQAQMMAEQLEQVQKRLQELGAK